MCETFNTEIVPYVQTGEFQKWPDVRVTDVPANDGNIITVGTWRTFNTEGRNKEAVKYLPSSLETYTYKISNKVRTIFMKGNLQDLEDHVVGTITIDKHVTRKAVTTLTTLDLPEGSMKYYHAHMSRNIFAAAENAVAHVSTGKYSGARNITVKEVSLKGLRMVDVDW